VNFTSLYSENPGFRTSSWTLRYSDFTDSSSTDIGDDKVRPQPTALPSFIILSRISTSQKRLTCEAHHVMLPTLLLFYNYYLLLTANEFVPGGSGNTKTQNITHHTK
jgi:hypothetical protein